MGMAMGLFSLLGAAAFAPVPSVPLPSQGAVSVPDVCSGPENWAASSALAHLYNAKLVKRGDIDSRRTKVTLLASEQRGDTYRLVHHIQFTTTGGKSWSVITRSDANAEECSLGDVEMWLVENALFNAQPQP